jgi:hypothetical protein
MLLSLDARRGRLLTNSPYTQTSGAELPSKVGSLHEGSSVRLTQPSIGEVPTASLESCRFVSRWFSLQVPSPDIRASGHASRRVLKTTFPQRTAPSVTANCIMHPVHVYEVRPRKDHRGVNLISDALPFGRLSYGEPGAIMNAIGYAKFFSRSPDAVIRVYDEAGNVIQTHEHAGRFQRVVSTYFTVSDNSGLDRQVLRATILLGNANP